MERNVFKGIVLSKEDIRKLPVVAFEGEIVLVDSPDKLKQCTKELSKEKVLGFDTESKPSHKKGVQHPVALVQLSTLRKVFLIRFNKIENFQEIFDILDNKSILKLGISIHRDLADLKQLNPFDESSFFDLNRLSKEFHFDHIGVRRLTAIFLSRRVSKTHQVSNWEANHLSTGQQKYAATDAWICCKLYWHIIEKKYLDKSFFRN